MALTEDENKLKWEMAAAGQLFNGEPDGRGGIKVNLNAQVLLSIDKMDEEIVRAKIVLWKAYKSEALKKTYANHMKQAKAMEDTATKDGINLSVQNDIELNG